MKALLGYAREVNNMDDLRIIELYFERDEQAIKETDSKYGKLCHSIAYNILNNREDSEECVNDTYVGVWNAIPPTRPNNFMAFICKIARNLSLKRLEFTKREKRSADIIISFEELAAVLPDERYAPNISDEDIGKIISEFLRNQKEDAKNVFIRKYYFFDSISEIAKRYSFTESKVKNMLFYTRNKLKDYLIREGVEI
ncbi:MAG: sigma-70 family RNA polymerase sigma factor [Clostridia bacterium]|nr:sigma-70 family RNA polymerase sigma factor [Clostridia bacterium]